MFTTSYCVRTWLIIVIKAVIRTITNRYGAPCWASCRSGTVGSSLSLLTLQQRHQRCVLYQLLTEVCGYHSPPIVYAKHLSAKILGGRGLLCMRYVGGKLPARRRQQHHQRQSSCSHQPVPSNPRDPGSYLPEGETWQALLPPVARGRKAAVILRPSYCGIAEVIIWLYRRRILPPETGSLLAEYSESHLIITATLYGVFQLRPYLARPYICLAICYFHLSIPTIVCYRFPCRGFLVGSFMICGFS